jgi:hypothetical protein
MTKPFCEKALPKTTGEFNKRFLAISYGNSIDGDTPTFVTPEEADKIIEAAQKEFPQPTPIKSAKGYNEVTPTPFEYQKWFKKWFGDEQP